MSIACIHSPDTLMGQANGKESRNKITGRDKAILEVKVQRDRLKQYQKRLSVVTQRETEIAKEHLSRGNKSLALLALKKRNYQNSLLENTQNQLWNLDQLVQSIEFAQVEAQVVSGLKTGNSILSKLQQELKIENVERLMEDTAEAITYQNEISQLLAGNESSVHVDDDSLLKELEELTERDKDIDTLRKLDILNELKLKPLKQEQKQEQEQEQIEIEVAKPVENLQLIAE